MMDDEGAVAAAPGGLPAPAPEATVASVAAEATEENMAAAPLSRWRFAALYVLPLMVLLAWVALPLARGDATLYLRDVLNTHLEMKWAQAIAMRQGYFPLIDPWRAGGQPLAGNPNAVPFYPTNLLYLGGTPFWALNAHFWIHLLLAPFACFWMARRWGLRREAAWAAAACYTLSGFYLSHLSFYNLIAGATLAPALVAGCLTLAGGTRRAAWGMPPLIALLWAMLLLGGDPLMAALAAALAGAALLVALRRLRGADRAGKATQGGSAADASGEAVRQSRPGSASAPREVAGTAPAIMPASPRTARARPRVAPRLVLALAAAAFVGGTLLALPQLVEFLRILPGSFRGHKGYTPLLATVASWDPRQVAEWLIPTVFGRLDLVGPGSFWGAKFFTDTPPYYPSLYPGLLALALVAAGGWPRRLAARFACGAIAIGIFFSLGRFNPLAGWLLERPWLSVLRYPVKFWLPLALGAALLCGCGFERLLGGPAAAAGAGAQDGVADAAWRRVRWTLAALGLALVAAWACLTLRPAACEGWMRRLIPAAYPASFVANERLRWAGLCLLSLLVVAALLLAASRSLRQDGQAWRAGPLLLGVHALAQVLLLRSLYPTDAVAPYRVPPPALALLPAGETVVNPEFQYLFGPSTLTAGHFPDGRAMWLERRAFYGLYSFTGPLWRRRFELNESAEGLDGFLTRMAQGSLKTASNAERLRLLAAWGVGRLIVDRALDPLPADARLLARIPSFGRELFVYEIADRAPEVMLARRIVPAPHLNAAFAAMTARGFSPTADVVMPGQGPPRPAGGGAARVVRRGPESLEIAADVGAGGSVLLLQRAYLLWSATIDGRPAAVQPANLHRVGLELPAGSHRVRIWIDRTPFNRALGGAALGLAALPLLAFAGARAGRRAAD
jgi:hypothetical protein